MTRKIIEYFGGRIWLDTTYTEGARFLFTLPVPPETLSRDGAETPNRARAETPNPDRSETPLLPPQGASGDRENEETDARLR
jgi:hypothetical protein